MEQIQSNSTYHPIPSIHLSSPVGVTAVSFDPVSDLLWTGSAMGLVTGYFGNLDSGYVGNITRGVTFPVRGETGVLKLLAGEKDVKALGNGGFGSWMKGGANKWQFIAQDQQLSTFSHHPTIPNTFVVASSTPSSHNFNIVNAVTGASMRHVQSPSHVSHLAHIHTLLVSGSVDGVLRTHDFRARGREESASENSCIAHTGGIQALETSGQYILTAGWGIRQSRPHADTLVKVFDARTLRPLPPVPFADLPSFIRPHPKKSSTIIIASSQGFVNVIDIANPAAADFNQIQTSSYLTSAAISPGGDYLAFGDAEGFVHLLSSTPENEAVPFNGYEGEPGVWAHEPGELPEINWTPDTPLSSVGLPYYKTPLLSSQISLKVPHGIQAFPPPAKIPPKVLETMRTVDFVGYAPLPKDLVGRRNLAPTVHVESGRFRSTRTARKPSDVDAVAEQVADVSMSDIPKPYRRVEIMYSKFGVEDFDFGYYNKTRYSGLETHIVNSYTNALLQALHFVHPVRRVAQSHIATPCQTEHCLLCEFGFLTRMLEDAKGVNCQASNFCKTIPKIQQGKHDSFALFAGAEIRIAGALGVVDYQAEGLKREYGAIIQVFNRFLLEEMSVRSDVPNNNPQLTTHGSGKSPVTQLMGIDAQSVVVCSACGAVAEKEALSHVVDLMYPRKPAIGATFSSLLSASILRETTHRSVCQSCRQQATFRSQRIVPANALPPVLAINAAPFTDDAASVWRRKGESFLTPRVDVGCGRDGEESVEYELKAGRQLSIVVEVRNETHAPHLVALAKVPEDGWYLFNDFVVQKVSEDEALSFMQTPCVLYLERVDNASTLDFGKLPMKMDPGILCRIDNMSWRMNKGKLAHKPLTPEELPKPGTLVAIDAEFVSLQKEENEMRSDAGDLDPYSSEHALVPLKSAYKKLRLLIDLGCIFIGHGLSKDFRIINIAVPKDQVLDTVDIYFLKERQRRIGLRFLSWYLLSQTIQIDTHNSIEDARAALLLYKLYIKLEEDRQFDETLDEIYREGRKLNWKTPGDPTSPKPAKAQVAGMSPSISGAFTPPYGSPGGPGAHGMPLPPQWRRK
ncbi:PAB-dependent poly(A)-specific ribonuclease subunit PAN2 [Ceratobasidium sp. AG-Ba]|nr:PAB-dependent poly(A)-specific ribonuclease subunit PAN2 [Ceratobasidium sp. AG-Ba]QRW14541.1 PAB-dependent poly(A)-specific ribonuclease subunit PAN2 [Ceratobasidium sp. AG-Ba]